MRFLPNETWSDVFEWLPIKNLCQKINLVNGRFAGLAENVLIRCHPLVAKLVWLKWDPEKLVYCLTIKNERCHQPNPIKHLTRYEMDFPIVPPPPNIVKIQSIRFEAHFDRDALRFLAQCTDRIDPLRYHLSFEDLANFVSELNRENIQLGEFFNAFSRSCARLWLDGRPCFLTSHFFLNPFVLRCPAMSIHDPKLGFDVGAVAQWIRWPISSQRTKRLSIYCNSPDSVESVVWLVDQLIVKHIENPVADGLDYVLELFGIKHQLKRKAFDDGLMRLSAISPNFMKLTKRAKNKMDGHGKIGENAEEEGGDEDNQSAEENLNILTYIDIGTFG